MTAAAASRDTTVGMATPSTPMWKTKIKRALPAMFMTFMPRETHMETLDQPITRNRAAPAL